MKRFLKSLIIPFLCFKITLAADDYPILFVAYEAMEARAFQEIMQVLDRKKISYGIISFSIAKELLQNQPQQIDIYKKCHFKTHMDKKSWEASQRVAETDINRLAKCFKPNVMVTGTSSIAQAQISQAFATRGTNILAFYPEIKPPTKNTIAQSVAQYAHVLTVAAKRLIPEFRISNINQSKIKVFGHPSMEFWRKEIQHIDKKMAREELGFKDTQRPIVLYMGGHGEGYEQSFEIFVQSMAEMLDKDIIIKPHPTSDGTTELAILAMHHAQNYRFLPPGLTTKAAAIADYVVTQRSRAAMQAYFANIPVIYLNARPPGTPDILVEKGNVPNTSSKQEFLQALQTIKRQELSKEQITKITGIPFDAAQSIANEIIKLFEDAKLRQDPLYKSDIEALL